MQVSIQIGFLKIHGLDLHSPISHYCQQFKVDRFSLGSGLNSTLQNVYLKNGVKRSNLVFDPTKKQPPCNSAAAKVCNLDAKVDHI
jgi:hypothetical protein